MDRIHSPDLALPVSERWICKPVSGPCCSGKYVRPLLQPSWGTCAVVHASCYCTERAALARRVFVVGEEGTKGAKLAFRKVTKELAKRFGSPRLSPWTEEQVVSSVPAGKREVYRRALESLEVKPLSHKDSKVSMFVKADKLTEVGVEVKKPRAIQGRTPRFNVKYGKYIKPIEHYLCGWKGVRRGVPRTRVFAKGLDWKKRADLTIKKLENFKYCYSLDASSFDASVRVWHLLGVHRVYKALIGADEEFKWLMKETLVNEGVTAHGIWYKIVGNRMSGDMDTGIGNSLLAFLLVWTVMRSMGLSKWDLLCDGDDILVFTDRKVEKSEWITQGANLGFTWKVEAEWTRGDPLEDIEFCRHRMVCVDNEWRFVRGMRALANFGVTHVHTSLKAHRRYMKGVAMSEFHASKGVPCSSVLSYCVYSKMALEKALIVEADKYKFGSYVSGLGDLPVRWVDITSGTRASYYLAFGVTEEEQLRYETQVETIVDVYLRGTRVETADAVIVGDKQEWLYPELNLCVL